MPVNKCHENAAKVWGKDVKGTQLIHGYALLPEDGFWRQHSWAVKDGKLLETNTPMYEQYFGIELNKEQSARSWVADVLLQNYPQWGPEAQRFARLYPKVMALISKLRKQELRRKRRSLRVLFSK
jgi:hypothetical protein